MNGIRSEAPHLAGRQASQQLRFVRSELEQTGNTSPLRSYFPFCTVLGLRS
jgi:hypothetical protein